MQNRDSNYKPLGTFVNTVSSSWPEFIDYSSSSRIAVDFSGLQTLSPALQKSGSDTAHLSNSYEFGTTSNYPHCSHIPYPQFDPNHNSASQDSRPPRLAKHASTTAYSNFSPSNAQERFVCKHCPLEKRTVCRSSKDLERHTKSVHEIYQRGDKFWVCHVPGCTKASKKWPRLDNFTSHVERMHPNEDTKNIVARALCVFGEEDASEYLRTPESGYMSATDSLDYDEQLDCDYVFGSYSRFKPR